MVYLSLERRTWNKIQEYRVNCVSDTKDEITGFLKIRWFDDAGREQQFKSEYSSEDVNTAGTSTYNKIVPTPSRKNTLDVYFYLTSLNTRNRSKRSRPSDV